jgi:predicted Zn-dependent protease
MSKHIHCIVLVFLFILTSCATSPTGRHQLMLVSPETAILSSKSAYVQTLHPLAKAGKLNNDPVLTRRIRKLSGRLIYQAIEQYPHTRNWEWSVQLIDDPKMVNAWCMAGGKMAIYTGLLKQVKPTDDELAQVMGHEIAHALANHTAEKMSMAMASQIGLMAVAFGVNDSEYRGAAMSGSVLAATLAIQLPNSRTAETEADRMGIELAAKAGYNPYAAATLWQKMEQTGGSGPPQFLSTHPAPGNRQQTLRTLAPQMMRYYHPDKPHPVYPLQ